MAHGLGVFNQRRKGGRMIHAAVTRTYFAGGVEHVEGQAFKQRGWKVVGRMFQLPVDEVYQYDVTWHKTPEEARKAAVFEGQSTVVRLTPELVAV